MIYAELKLGNIKIIDDETNDGSILKMTKGLFTKNYYSSTAILRSLQSLGGASAVAYVKAANYFLTSEIRHRVLFESLIFDKVKDLAEINENPDKFTFSNVVNCLWPKEFKNDATVEDIVRTEFGSFEALKASTKNTTIIAKAPNLEACGVSYKEFNDLYSNVTNTINVGKYVDLSERISSDAILGGGANLDMSLDGAADIFLRDSKRYKSTVKFEHASKIIDDFKPLESNPGDSKSESDRQKQTIIKNVSDMCGIDNDIMKINVMLALSQNSGFNTFVGVFEEMIPNIGKFHSPQTVVLYKIREDGSVKLTWSTSKAEESLAYAECSVLFKTDGTQKLEDFKFVVGKEAYEKAIELAEEKKAKEQANAEAEAKATISPIFVHNR